MIGDKTGRALERQVADLYRALEVRKVEHDVLMAGHQIDVYVEMAGPDGSLHRIAVEVKDWQSRVGVDVVCDWTRVVEDLRRAGLVDEGVIVSLMGFTKPARQEVAAHVRRGLPVRLQELADLQASVGVVPILGVIRAGEPIPVPDDKFRLMGDETIMLPRDSRDSLRELKGLYALRVEGKSMIDALVDDGDIIIVHPQRCVWPREMAVIWLKEYEDDVDGKTTLKYFYREEGGRVRLQPANPAMMPIYIDDPNLVKVQGKVVWVIRRYSDQQCA